MKFKPAAAFIFALLLLFLATSSSAQERLTYVDLVNRLLDLECVATLPQVGEMTAQASSYDRRSRYDAQTDKYIDWQANGDGAIPPTMGDSQQFLLADLKGPGVIWRMWSALGGKGHVQVYLDGPNHRPSRSVGKLANSCPWPQ